MYNPSMSLPSNIIIGRSGHVYAYFTGYNPGYENEIRYAIEEVLDADK